MILFLALAALQAAHAPQALTPLQPAAVGPEWIAKPTAEDLAAVYPPGAAARGIEGRTLIACRVTAVGQMGSCTIEAEEPAREGFGMAALRLASKFRMSPRLANGKSVEGGRVRIPIFWRTGSPTTTSTP